MRRQRTGIRRQDLDDLGYEVVVAACPAIDRHHHAEGQARSEQETDQRRRIATDGDEMVEVRSHDRSRHQADQGHHPDHEGDLELGMTGQLELDVITGARMDRVAGRDRLRCSRRRHSLRGAAGVVRASIADSATGCLDTGMVAVDGDDGSYSGHGGIVAIQSAVMALSPRAPMHPRVPLHSGSKRGTSQSTNPHPHLIP